ncbi:MAG: nucleoside hydrolase [Alphaproteobacteria bacterium]|nr:nucleoside hydrolase [Alphaproteobacteria bacterium]
MPRPIIFDCDPGNDDAVALLVTLACPEEFTLLGITTVAGNVSLENTHVNARKICELAGRPDILVHAGCPRPFVGPPIFSDGAHGNTGIDGAVLPNPEMPLQKMHAVDFILKTLTEHPEPVTVFITGPATNVAMAINKQPEILKNIAEFVIMGGSITAGNITPSAEFNFYCDPFAAKVVLDAGIKTTLLTLDVTHHVLATPENIEKLYATGNNQATQVAHMMQASMAFDLDNFNLKGRAIHDACVPIFILHPELFTTHPAYVHVETAQGNSYANSIISFYPKHVPQKPWIQVPREIQGEKVFEAILQKLGRYTHS